MKKSLFAFLCLILVAKISAQNTDFNNVSIGTDGPAYGVKIKANFPNVTAGWARSFSVVNENDSNNYIVFGSFGGFALPFAPIGCSHSDIHCHCVPR